MWAMSKPLPDARRRRERRRANVREYLKWIWQRAEILASQSNCQHQMSCVLLDKKGRYVAEGYNKRKTHPLMAKYAKKANEPNKIYLHAELSALISPRSRQSPHTAFIFRKTASGTGIARPCRICREALVEAGVKEVVYTTSRGYAVEQLEGE